jgi:hypothetical protein
MTEETFLKAQDLDSRISRLSYEINLANQIKTEYRIKIVGRNPRGDERLLGTLEKDDSLREYIAEVIRKRLTQEQESLITEFNNL